MNNHPEGAVGSVFDSVTEHNKEREKSVTGAEREAPIGKGRFDLVPYHPHFRLAVHYENGAKKYAERNWEKGLPLHRFLESAERHLGQFKEGDRSEDHLAAVLWNVYGYLETERRIAQGKLPSALYDVPWNTSIVYPPIPSSGTPEASRVPEGAPFKP